MCFGQTLVYLILSAQNKRPNIAFFVFDLRGQLPLQSSVHSTLALSTIWALNMLEDVVGYSMVTQVIRSGSLHCRILHICLLKVSCSPASSSF